MQAQQQTDMQPQYRQQAQYTQQAQSPNNRPQLSQSNANYNLPTEWDRVAPVNGGPVSGYSGFIPGSSFLPGGTTFQDGTQLLADYAPTQSMRPLEQAMSYPTMPPCTKDFSKPGYSGHVHGRKFDVGNFRVPGQVDKPTLKDSIIKGGSLRLDN